MNQLFKFNSEGFGSVRVHVDAAGEPWFVTKDVAEILGLQNIRQNLSELDEDEKITVTNPDGNPRAGIPHQLALVSESGLYALIFRSRKPEAKAFSKWVRTEILPSIRKTGQYALTPRGYIEALRALADAEEAKLKALGRVEKLENQLGIGKEWKAAKAVPWVKDYFVESRGFWSQLGKKLTALSKEMGYDILRSETSDYPDGVGLYHIRVIEALKDKLEYDRNMLRKWRK